MTMTDPVADLLTRIRNVNRMQRMRVQIPHSKLKESIVDVLKREGFIESYEVSGDNPIERSIEIRLKYGPDGERVINRIERVSKPGRRRHEKIKDLDRVVQGMGIYVLSTSKGILSDNEARAQNVGGEVLLSVY